MGSYLDRGPCEQCGCPVVSQHPSARRHVICPTCGNACKSAPRLKSFPPVITFTPAQQALVREIVEATLRDAAVVANPDTTFDARFEDGATILVTDWHIPVHHRRASDSLIHFAEDQKSSGWLKRLVLGGDVFDGHGNTRHKQLSRSEGHGGDLGDEIETGRGLINALVECFPTATFMEGNHEARLWRVLAEQKGIPEAPLVFESLFQFYDYHSRLQVHNNRSLFIGNGTGAVEIIHGERYNQHTAAALLNDNMNRNSAQGHSHRPQAFWRRGQFAVVNGHLHDVDKQQYMKNPEWTMGFTIFEHWDNGRKCNPYFVRIAEDGSFAWHGKVYRG